MLNVSGQLRKMTHEENDPIQYFLSLDEKPVPITPEVGKTLTVRYLGKITCVECGRPIKKTYNEGYCFPCFRDLPENASCAIRPEECRHEFGNEKDKEFFREYCNIDHFVYLSLTSCVKVGVTRHFNIPSRWIDQGAEQGLIIARTPQRVLAGRIEVALANHMPDKTNWRKMILGENAGMDLLAYREKAQDWIPKELSGYALNDEQVHYLSYPIQSVPKKISSYNLDKEEEFTDRLTGIKGQYLIFQNKVINLRKYAGYHLEFSVKN